MKKILLAVGAALAFGLVACAEPPAPIIGKLAFKYIEDRHEYTLVVVADTGETHHLTVTRDQWLTFQPNADGTYGQVIDSRDLFTPDDDD